MKPRTYVNEASHMCVGKHTHTHMHAHPHTHTGLWFLTSLLTLITMRLQDTYLLHAREFTTSFHSSMSIRHTDSEMTECQRHQVRAGWTLMAVLCHFFDCTWSQRAAGPSWVPGHSRKYFYSGLPVHIIPLAQIPFCLTVVNCDYTFLLTAVLGGDIPPGNVECHMFCHGWHFNEYIFEPSSRFTSTRSCLWVKWQARQSPVQSVLGESRENAAPRCCHSWSRLTPKAAYFKMNFS